MKKWLIILTTLVFCMSTFTAISSAADKKLSEITIGITGFNFGVDSYQTTYEKAFEEHCKKLGVKYIKLDPKGDAALQANQVEDLIQKKVDVIIVWPVSGKGIIPAIRKANAANIPVLVTNSPIDPSGEALTEGFCGPDNVLEGKYAGEMMVEALGGKGKVVEIMGFPGYVTAAERSQGFHDAVKGHSGIEIIETQPGNWDRMKSQKVMENFLVKYGPGDFNGVYVADDNMGMGAVNALKAAGRLKDVVITSACMFGEGYDAMGRGEIWGTVYQSPTSDAQIAVDTAIKVAQGQEIPKKNFFETPKVTHKVVHLFKKPPF